MDIDAPTIGKAGELRVVSELLLRGLKPAMFFHDTGADIVLESGVRLQVKTSLRPTYSKKDYSWRYSFSIRMSQFRKGKDGKYERRYTRKRYMNVDYFVFWLVEHNFFYIVPEGEVGEKLSLCISTKGRKFGSKYEQYKGNWEQLR